MLTRSLVLAWIVVTLAACGSSSSSTPALPLNVAAPLPAFTAFAVPYLTQIQTAPIIQGPDHALWFSENDSIGGQPSLIGRLTPGGVLTQISRGASGNDAINGFTNGSDGDIYFGQQLPIMGRVTPEGVVAALPLPSSGAVAVTAGSDGAIWFTDSSPTSPEIARLDRAGNVTKFPLPSSLITVPYQIAAGSDGALWVTDGMGQNILRVTVAGAVSAIATTVNPSEIVSGPDGAIWFLDIAGDQIGRIAVGSHAVTLFSTSSIGAGAHLTSGPDGALWFADNAGVGRMTTSGALSSFAVPAAKAGVKVDIGGMAAGPDQAIWFTDLFANRVCRLSVTAPRTPAGTARQRRPFQGS